MATAFTFNKLVGDISSGSSFVVNKLASGNTASVVAVFNAQPYLKRFKKVYMKIGSVKVGGQNIFNEEIKISYEFGTFSGSTFYPYSGYNGVATPSDTVSEKDGNTSSSAEITLDVVPEKNLYVAFRITVSSTISSRGAEVVMSNFQLSADLEDYIEHLYTFVSPEEGGLVTGGGSYADGSTATLTAIPNSGYKFVKWQDENTQNPRTVTVINGVHYTAYFEVDKINNILIDTVKPKKILIDNQEVKAIFVDTTKVYG